MTVTPGRLLCVGGPPGSGKTTVGTLVAHARRAALVDLDSVTTPLVEAMAAAVGEAADLDAPRWAGLRDARYACLAAVAGDALAAGVDVVAVAPFTREAATEGAWHAWGAAAGARSVTTCRLVLDPAVAAERARTRGLVRDLAKAGPPSGPAPSDGVTADVVLDASEAPEVVAERLTGAWDAHVDGR